MIVIDQIAIRVMALSSMVLFMKFRIYVFAGKDKVNLGVISR